MRPQEYVAVNDKYSIGYKIYWLITKKMRK